MTPSSSVEAFILAGGLSRRMGTPKALLEVGGRPMIARVLEAVTRVVSPVTLVTDRAEEVSFLGCPVISDHYHAAGPLGGLHASLNAARSDGVLVVSCDLPFLDTALLTALVRHRGKRPITIPRTDRLHPVCAVYDRSLAPLADRLLREGRRSMLGFVEEAGYDAIDVAALEPPIDPLVLANINSPDELAAARSRRP